MSKIGAWAVEPYNGRIGLIMGQRGVGAWYGRGLDSDPWSAFQPTVLAAEDVTHLGLDNLSMDWIESAEEFEVEVLEWLTREKRMPRHDDGSCPECGSIRLYKSGFAEGARYRCRDCSWVSDWFQD